MFLCAPLLCYLYQAHFDFGSNSHIWPVSLEMVFFVYLFMYVINFQNDIFKITQVKEHSLIKKYIEEYLVLQHFDLLSN